MFNLNENCCICLDNKQCITHLSKSDGDGIPFYIKLTSSIPEMRFAEINDQNLICKECCDSVNIVYTFRQKCLQNKIILLESISKLNSANNTNVALFYHKDTNETVKNINYKTGNDNKIDDHVARSSNNDNCNVKNIDSKNMIHMNDTTYVNQIKIEEIQVKLEDMSENEQDYNSVTMSDVNEEVTDWNVDKEVSNISDNIKVRDESNITNYSRKSNITLNYTYESENVYKLTIAKDEINLEEVCEKEKISNTDKNITTSNINEEVNDLNKVRQTNNMFENRNKNVDYTKNRDNYTHFEEINIKIEESVVNVQDLNIKNCDEIKIEETDLKFERLENEQGTSREDVYGLDEVAGNTEVFVKETLTNYLDKTVQNTKRQHPYKCNTYNKKFSKTSNLETDLVIDSGDERFNCKLCDKKYNSITYLKRHMKYHSEENHYACNICKTTFATTTQLKEHMMIHSGDKSYICKICDEKFTENGALKIHMKLHSGEKFVICKICNKTFTGNKHLNVHMRIHSGEKPFSCKICDRKFTIKGNLKTHMMTHSGEKPFSCEICNKSFTRKETLQIHTRMHFEIKPFSCKLCGVKFTRNETLKIHMRTHSGEKPFSCEICDKMFTTSGNLKTHMVVHSEEEQISCQICSKKFIANKYLKIHMRMHTEKKPYSCKVCNKMFTIKESLTAHMVVHAGVKAFSCEFCDKKFTRSDALQRHKRIHLEIMPFSCKMCDEKFTRNEALKTHMVLHSG